jgi:O-antigen/teichoic acid export membrane protein
MNLAGVTPELNAITGRGCAPPSLERPCNAPLSLKRNTAWIIAGTAMYAGAQWMQVTTVARLGSVAEVGHFVYALALTTPIFMLANLQLRPIQAVDSRRAYDLADYLGLRLVTTALALAVTLGLTGWLADSPATAALIVIVAISKSIESISDIYQGVFQQRERMDCVGRSLLLKSLLILPLFLVLYHATRSLLWAAAGIPIVHLATLLTYDMRASHWVTHGFHVSGFREMFRHLDRPRFERRKLQKLAVRALPLGVTMMLSSLQANAPRLIIEHFVGSFGVGIFAAINYLPTAAALVVNALGSAASPRMAAQLGARDFRAFRITLAKLVALAAIFGIAGVSASVWMGPQLLRALYGEEYAKYNVLLLWSMAGAGIGYLTSVFGFAATATGGFKRQPYALALSILSLLAASAVLVPHFGLAGAAFASVISSATCLCAFMAIVFRRRQ